MNIIINKEIYNISTNLKLAYKIQDIFKKPYMKVLEILTSSEANIEDQITFLYLGYEIGGGLLSKDEFQNLISESIGINQLINYLEQAVVEMQYPGMSETEIEEEIKKKLEKIRMLSSIGMK